MEKQTSRAEADLQRLHQLEADLEHINRVSMMGEMASSICHQIKQPMASAVLNAGACALWLKRETPDIEEAREAASKMINNLTHASEILDRIHSFYRRDSLERELVDLNEIIREMIVLLQDRANRAFISIQTELHSGLPLVAANRLQLQQVLMNLMVNGIEAINDASGELTITSKKAEDGQLLISVRDSGIGLPKGQMEHIFDAFFTTKPQGTGMGLPISLRIIESYGGRLWAAANSGGGANFQFTLPSELVVSSHSAA